VRVAAQFLWLPAVLALGACSAPQLPSMESFRPPDPATLFRPLSVGVIQERQLLPVAAEDMVDAEGRCAGTFPVAEAVADPSADPNAPQPTQQVNLPLIPGGIALDMTECDVVKRAGPPERVEIGANERNERTAVLTYIRSERPGIYRFTSGRLTAMERAPEPPPEPKPQRRTQTRRAATR
jgi:hypothetical protein